MKKRLDKVFSKEIEGITHRIFPSTKTEIQKYFFRRSYERSPFLIRELKKELLSLALFLLC